MKNQLIEYRLQMATHLAKLPRFSRNFLDMNWITIVPISLYIMMQHLSI